LKATTKYLRIKEYIEVTTAIMIITVIGTTATTEIVLLVTEAAGVIVEQAALLVIRVMEAQATMAIETNEIVLVLNDTDAAKAYELLRTKLK
jgi:hypothetical protein